MCGRELKAPFNFADCGKFENRCGEELFDAGSGKNSSSRLLLLSNFIYYNFCYKYKSLARWENVL